MAKFNLSQTLGTAVEINPSLKVKCWGDKWLVLKPQGTGWYLRKPDRFYEIFTKMND